MKHAILSGIVMMAATIAGPAEAQQYFMRKPLTARAVTIHDGKWSYGSWSDAGSCNGTTKPQTRTATCGGTSCDPAKKEATTQNAACTSGCEAPGDSRWTGRFINGNTTYRTHTKSIASYAEFEGACNSLYKQYGIGACFLSVSSTGKPDYKPIYPGNALYYEQYAWTTFANRPDLIAANCGQ